MELKLKTIREVKKLSTYEIAKKMQITQSAYTRFERGESKIDLERLEVFAEATGMSIVDVLMYPEQYIKVRDIAKNQRENEPDVIIQIKVKEEQREGILKIILGEDNLDLFK